MFKALAAIVALASAAPAPVPTPQTLSVTVIHAPRAPLHVQVARTEPQRERGLMGVTHLARHTGMLFVFERDEQVDFWMKDTLIPLDMVFVSADGVVREVYDNVRIVPRTLPDSDIPLEAGHGKYVIELAAGEAGHDGLIAGARVTGLPK